MEEDTTQYQAWPLLVKLPKNELTSLVENYMAYTSKVKYIYISIVVFMALIVGYNLFFGGKSYPYAEAKSIENTFAIVICIFLVGFLVVAGIVISAMLKVKKAVRQTAKRHRLDAKAVVREFHNFVKTTIGGPGLK